MGTFVLKLPGDIGGIIVSKKAKHVLHERPSNRSSLDIMYKDDQESITSCTPVFRVFPKNAMFQRQIFGLGLKREAISIGNFPLDCS